MPTFQQGVALIGSTTPHLGKGLPKPQSVLHESSGHECLKSSLAFRWPGMAVVSGRMARADGVYIGIERPGVPGAWRSPGSAGGGSWLAHRSRIMLGVRDGYQNDAACTAMRAVRSPIVDGRTQWMVL